MTQYDEGYEDGYMEAWSDLESWYDDCDDCDDFEYEWTPPHWLDHLLSIN
jgi:hypothetical protein